MPIACAWRSAYTQGVTSKRTINSSGQLEDMAAPERFLYKGRVVRPGWVVTAKGRYFRVVRVWGHHIMLQPLAEDELASRSLAAVAIVLQPEAK